MCRVGRGRASSTTVQKEKSWGVPVVQNSLRHGRCNADGAVLTVCEQHVGPHLGARDACPGGHS
jgi:hypothetical protein